MREPATDPGSIAVRVTLFADLRRFLPPGAQGTQRCQLPAGATVGDLLGRLGVPPDYDLTAGVDGELGNRQTVLRDGAEVVLLGAMEGGA